MADANWLVGDGKDLNPQIAFVVSPTNAVARTKLPEGPDMEFAFAFLHSTDRM